MSATDIVIAPHILLPRLGIDLHKFAVIACDQFTSQVSYWQQLEKLVGDNPSSLRLIFPEAYLPIVDHSAYIDKINRNIDSYLHEGILSDIGEGFILVERTTPYHQRRLGLMIAIDLEAYSYDKGTHAPIRASEATIVDRIPPRLKIRENAAIELPHVLVLFDDPSKSLMKSIYEQKDRYPLVYDFDLNQNGGHLKGYFIAKTDAIIASFEKLMDKSNLMFIVGDGNHSLATAKAHWDKIKGGLNQEKLKSHPARYSLVEAMNIYDEGLEFEAIHRVIINPDHDFIEGLKRVQGVIGEGFFYSKEYGKRPLMLPKNSPQAYREIQDYIDSYLLSHKGAAVDYIHGVTDLIKVADEHPGSVALAMPSLTKEDIFAYLAKGEVLPRKCFSMGHAAEKRYYLESKLIKHKGE